MYDRAEALTVARMDFGDRYPGLVVRVTAPTLRARALAPRVVTLFGSSRPQDVTRAVELMAGAMADSLLSWTLHWAGRPVPTTRRGVLSVDQGLLVEILQEWITLWPRLCGSATTEPLAEPVFDDRLLADAPMVALVPDDDAEPAQVV